MSDVIFAVALLLMVSSVIFTGWWCYRLGYEEGVEDTRRKLDPEHRRKREEEEDWLNYPEHP